MKLSATFSVSIHVYEGGNSLLTSETTREVTVRKKEARPLICRWIFFFFFGSLMTTVAIPIFSVHVCLCLYCSYPTSLLVCHSIWLIRMHAAF
jgi:hypothetical protein